VSADFVALRIRIFYPNRRFYGKLCLLIKKEADVRIVMITIVIVLWLASPSWAENGFKESVRQVGQGFKELGKDFKKSSKEIAQNFKKEGERRDR
jgi:hypothetical protein